MGTSIRAQASITLHGDYRAAAGAEAVQRFGLERDCDASVENSTISIEVPIPDFINKFRNTAAWGGSTGGQVQICGNLYRCQFRIRVDGLHQNGLSLSRQGRVLQLRNSEGHILKEMNDILPTPDETLAAFRAALGGTAT